MCIYIYGFGLDPEFVTQLWVKPRAEQRVTNPCKHPQLKGAKFSLATTGSCCWGRNRESSAETRLSRGLWLGSRELGSAGTRFSPKENVPCCLLCSHKSLCGLARRCWLCKPVVCAMTGLLVFLFSWFPGLKLPVFLVHSTQLGSVATQSISLPRASPGFA